MGISVAVARIFDLIFLILFVSILLSWIPSIKWYNEPFKTLHIVSEFFLAPFRALIPPIGMIDISPIVAFFLLSIVRNALVRILVALGL